MASATALNGATRPKAKAPTQNAGPAKPSARTTSKETKTMASKADSTIFSRVSESVKSTSDSFKETYGSLLEQQRKLGLQLIGYAEENTKHGFDTWRAVLESENLNEAVKIQTDAVRETVQRNMEQARETAELVTEISRDTLRPVGDLVSKVRSNQAAA